MSAYRPYPKTKPSGIEWVGDIPSHWSVGPTFAKVSESKSKNSLGGRDAGRRLQTLREGRVETEAFDPRLTIWLERNPSPRIECREHKNSLHSETQEHSRDQPMNQGLCIAFEGIDGSGKSTHSGLLGEFLTNMGLCVVVEHEPTAGPWGKKLRESAATGRLAPEDELQYFLNDRRQHVEELIAPSLAAGKVVILDRYYFSTMAYQGARGFDPAEIRRKNEEFAPVPDLLLIMDLDVDSALERIGARGDTANEFEKRENLERCREIFLSLKGESFVRVIDTRGTLDEVAARVREAVGSHLV